MVIAVEIMFRIFDYGKNLFAAKTVIRGGRRPANRDSQVGYDMTSHFSGVGSSVVQQQDVVGLPLRSDDI